MGAAVDGIGVLEWAWIHWRGGGGVRDAGIGVGNAETGWSDVGVAGCGGRHGGSSTPAEAVDAAAARCGSCTSEHHLHRARSGTPVVPISDVGIGERLRRARLKTPVADLGAGRAVGAIPAALAEGVRRRSR